MKKFFYIVSLAIMLHTTIMAQLTNPFFTDWKTPFGVPPFDQIKNEHYMPAILEGIKQQQAEIQTIATNTSVPTFENTILPLDHSGVLLEKAGSVFYGVNGANTSPELQEIAKQLSPVMTKHSDDINLNPDLFRKVKSVYDQMDQLNLDPLQKRVVDELYKGFIRGGAGLDNSQKEKLRDLNKQISMLQLTFGQNLLSENNSYKLIIDDPKDLSGLPEGLIVSAKETADSDSATKGKWVFTLQNPSVMPFLQFSANRALREKIYTAYINRGNTNNDKDNKKIIEKLVKLRQEKANLMGFPTFADFVLDDRMAKTPDKVYELINKVWGPSIDRAKEEKAQLVSIMEKDFPGVPLQAYDWRYYSEKVLQENYNLDENEIKPYFKLENVRNGVFYVANKLYGITFSEVINAPVYYNGVTLWECKDNDGSHLGVLYLDFHPRASKRGGAWCGSYRSQTYKDGKRIAPVMTIVCNFSAPAGNQPALLTADEAETFFHEFGHALHGLFRDVKYEALSGVPRDFVELPSQIMEHWTFEPEVLKVYAKHYQTGEVIPDNLVKKIVDSGKFGQGFKTTEYLAASILDMDYHTMKDATVADITEFERNSLDKMGIIREIQPRYRSTYFQHTMTGGYTAGYYSYIWAEVLDADAFQAFKETGNIFDKTTAYKFRKAILEQGGSKEAMDLYLDFRGKKPGIEPLLENRGLVTN